MCLLPVWTALGVLNPLSIQSSIINLSTARLDLQLWVTNTKQTLDSISDINITYKNELEIKSQSTASVQLSAYAGWLIRGTQTTPQTGNDSWQMNRRYHVYYLPASRSIIKTYNIIKRKPLNIYLYLFLIAFISNSFEVTR